MEKGRYRGEGLHRERAKWREDVIEREEGLKSQIFCRRRQKREEGLNRNISVREKRG